MVIAGGDGTLMRLLPIIVAAERPIGLLPLGTVNLLGKDLGFTGDLLADARLAAGTDISRVSLAKAGTTLFHSNAGLGILGRMAREREEARGGSRSVASSASSGPRPGRWFSPAPCRLPSMWTGSSAMSAPMPFW